MRSVGKWTGKSSSLLSLLVSMYSILYVLVCKQPTEMPEKTIFEKLRESIPEENRMHVEVRGRVVFVKVRIWARFRVRYGFGD